MFSTGHGGEQDAWASGRHVQRCPHQSTSPRAPESRQRPVAARRTWAASVPYRETAIRGTAGGVRRRRRCRQAARRSTSAYYPPLTDIAVTRRSHHRTSEGTTTNGARQPQTLIVADHDLAAWRSVFTLPGGLYGLPSIDLRAIAPALLFGKSGPCNKRAGTGSDLHSGDMDHDGWARFIGIRRNHDYHYGTLRGVEGEAR